MYQSFKGGLGGIALAKHGRSRAINAENPHGEKGKGGMAASHLGPSRKGSPCLRDIEPGATVTLAEMEGPGEINPRSRIMRISSFSGRFSSFASSSGLKKLIQQLSTPVPL